MLDIISQLRADLGVSVIFSTSDIALATRFSDRVLVMENGVLVEEAGAMELYSKPQTSAAKAIVEVSSA